MSTPASSGISRVHVPCVVGAHVDRIADNHGTTKRFVSQLDTPDDVPPGGRVPVDRRIARLDDRRLEWRRDGRRGHNAVSATGPPRCDSGDSTQRPLCFATQCRDRLPPPSAPPGPTAPSVRCFPERRPRRCAHRGSHPSALRSTAARQTAQPGRCLRAPHTPPIGRRGSDRPALCQGLCRMGRARTDGRQGLRRVDADVWILVRKSIDESTDRRAGSLAQSAQGACGIARDHRLLVSQRSSQCRLNPFRMGRQVDQVIDGAAPNGVRLMPQHVHQQRNGRRTDPPDDLKSHHMQVFMLEGEKSSQQRQRTPGSFDQSGFGGCADLRIVGQQAICPVTYRAGLLERLDSV